jgi:phosphogluconate dehydratase
MNWTDFDAVSQVTPLMARVYPNGSADINHFHAAGGTGYLFRTLLDMGLMHGDAKTCFRADFADFTVEPSLTDRGLEWCQAPSASLDPEVIANPDTPFAEEGGVRLLTGNLGRSVIKVSAVAEAHHGVRAPAVVIDSQNALKALFDSGELDRDCVVLVRFQGPAANGMPELHKLTPMLGVLQDRGYQVALVTDGRMSGASGKVPAAIHLSPEAVAGGVLARVENGDMIALDAHAGTLVLEVDEATLAKRAAATPPTLTATVGRGIFASSRVHVGDAERGASTLFAD